MKKQIKYRIWSILLVLVVIIMIIAAMQRLIPEYTWVSIVISVLIISGILIWHKISILASIFATVSLAGVTIGVLVFDSVIHGIELLVGVIEAEKFWGFPAQYGLLNTQDLTTAAVILLFASVFVVYATMKRRELLTFE